MTVSKTTGITIPFKIVLVTEERQKNICAMGSSKYYLGKGADKPTSVEEKTEYREKWFKAMKHPQKHILA